jgi:hypothetical protein
MMPIAECREPFDSPLILSLSPFDAAQGDPELVEGSKDERLAQDSPANAESNGAIGWLVPVSC